jgi:hypothetical protein
MHGTLPPGRGVNYTSDCVGLPNGLGKAPGLSRRLEPLAETGGRHACSATRVAVRPRRGRRSLAGSTPGGDFSDAAEGARTIGGFCFEVFEPGEHDG